MPRGTKSVLGDRFVNKNGYTYEKTNRGWEAVHQIIAEEKLKRRPKPDEQVYFKDGNRGNIDPSNIGIKLRKSQSPERRLTLMDARIEDMKDQLFLLIQEREELAREIAREKSNSQSNL
jgi:hypothetical protein